MKRLVSTLTVTSLMLSPFGHTSTQLNSSWGVKGQFGVDAVVAQKMMRKKCVDSSVTIAVIDTGLDVSHPSLKNSLWENKSEKNGKPGIDDDQNGYVDDVHGWDYVTRSGKIVDKHGHGTHISGIIAAHATEEDDFLGVCPGAKIMSLRYYDPNATGDENLEYTIRAVEYAVENGAHIINYSGGGNSFSDREFKALEKAEQRGILVVAAAGNESNFADQKPYYPASYSELNNIVSVAAINSNGFKLPRSNYGVKNVHVAAPGQSILSTMPGGSFGYLTGTSQATAFVSGIAALLLVEGGSALGETLGQRTQAVKRIILDSVTRTENLNGLVRTSGFASAVNALSKLKGNGSSNIGAKTPVRNNGLSRKLSEESTSGSGHMYEIKIQNSRTKIKRK